MQKKVRNNQLKRSNRYSLVIRAAFVGAVLFLSSCGQKGPLYSPPGEAEIRFYSLNKQKQQRELVLVPNASEIGCHNLPLTRSIYRVAQVGFTFCEIYREKDCRPGSQHHLRWSGPKKDSSKTELTTQITPGTKWIFSKADVAKVSSWSCQLN